jgi:hypothetical protein
MTLKGKPVAVKVIKLQKGKRRACDACMREVKALMKLQKYEN